MKRTRTALLAGIVAAPLLVGGFVFQERATTDGARLFGQVLDLVSSRFVDTVDAATGTPLRNKTSRCVSRFTTTSAGPSLPSSGAQTYWPGFKVSTMSRMARLPRPTCCAEALADINSVASAKTMVVVRMRIAGVFHHPQCPVIREIPDVRSGSKADAPPMAAFGGKLTSR